MNLYFSARLGCYGPVAHYIFNKRNVAIICMQYLAENYLFAYRSQLFNKHTGSLFYVKLHLDFELDIEFGTVLDL